MPNERAWTRKMFLALPPDVQAKMLRVAGKIAQYLGLPVELVRRMIRGERP